MKLRFGLLIIACCVLLASVFLGCEDEEGAISPSEEIEQPDDPGEVVEGFEINNARVRVAPEGGTTAAYMTIRNAEAEADTLLFARSEVAGTVEIHESYEQEDGTVGMRETDYVPVEAYSNAIFEPRGVHLMLIDLTRALESGESVDIELEFAQREVQTYSFDVIDLGASTEQEDEG